MSYRQLVFVHDALRASGCFERYMLMQFGRIVGLQKSVSEITMTGELWLNFNALEFRLQFSVFANLPRGMKEIFISSPGAMAQVTLPRHLQFCPRSFIAANL